MTTNRTVTLDGNEAVASSSYRINEVISIYPITPSSPMGEHADAWMAERRPNIWGVVPDVVEMQSEAGAAGAVHGALQSGALTTTYTASQGLLLMVPNLYKIAGELTSCCIHIAARTVATHALSIFGDHSDVMACRQTGFGLLASGTVQEAHDFACIGQAISLASRVPFLHFFDGFRTSHEVQKILELSDEDLAHLMNEEHIQAHRARALSPDRPVLRGTAQNPDVFFQAREAGNRFYDACPKIAQEVMDRFAARTGRAYKLFEYHGAPDAEKVVVLMGSGGEPVHEVVEWMNAHGAKVGVVKVRLYRPFSTRHLLGSLPKTVRRIAVLDRTKEPGAVGEPLYTDVVTAIREAREEGWTPFAADPSVVGGRYGLSSKEFNAAMVKAVFDNLDAARPRNHFTVGIVDDVTHHSLPVPKDFDIEGKDVVRAVFYGLGADGTVSANKNSIKIIGETTDNNVQGYFVYDSKKAGAMTISHLRFGPRPIRSTYLISKASFVACHQPQFLDQIDVLELAAPEAVFLLNTHHGPDEVWANLPVEMQRQIIAKKIQFYVIDAYAVAKATGMGMRINTVMQACFFAISGILPQKEAIKKIKDAIEKTYGGRGQDVVAKNNAAVDASIAHLHRVAYPDETAGTRHRRQIVPEAAPDFVKKVTSVMMAGKGDLLPVSAFPVDGTWPVGTTQWERRNIALEIPIWDAELCTQCNLCAFVCPHAAIRIKSYPPAALAGAPAGFKAVENKLADQKGNKYTVQVAPEDCTGCTLCVEICPAADKKNPEHKAIDMKLHREHKEQEAVWYSFFLKLPEVDPTSFKKMDMKHSQFLQPLFEYSGACSGCGETPYVRLMTQLFGDRALIGNATGCSSIYGGNLPTAPYTTNPQGRGPAWSNSLFEDNAEFAFGFRLAVDQNSRVARTLLKSLAPKVGAELVERILAQETKTVEGLEAQRASVRILKEKLAGIDAPAARRLILLADYLTPKSVWGVGGDGWAYDIGFGGLDHVMASGRNVNLLVLDTEVYSNTGGQQSKATPTGAAAKFATAGKQLGKKDLGLIAMTYGQVYVARVAFAAKPQQTVQAMLEAESFDGPSLIIAYSHCIEHGFEMGDAIEHQKLAVNTGNWALYRYDPRRIAEGKPPFQLDSGEPKTPLVEFTKSEARYGKVARLDRKRFEELQVIAQRDVLRRYAVYKHLAELVIPPAEVGLEIPVSAGK
ncbi:MAG: pyruvate:ferredoxin (flavodoxin) oxidoreductase [Planctomycetota bacterium]